MVDFKRQGASFLAVLIILQSALPVFAEGRFETDPGTFIKQVFTDSEPVTGTVWLTPELRESAAGILGHEPGFLRLRYWHDRQRSAWIIDEIGKTEPITIGVVINNARIEAIHVLAFRESRGWEVKHEFFTRQYLGLQLQSDTRLSGNIDGISGATLSVQAMNRVARLALLLASTLQS